MSKIWFTSDTHFYHTNIIKYCDRPYKDADEMNYKLIQNWNSVVKHDDIVYHCGDFCLGNKDKIANIAHQLNGRKFLICGNHDAYKATDYMQLGFEWATRHPIIYNKYLILSHEPVFLNANSVFGNVHGHCHQNEHRSMPKNGDPNLYFNVCVEKTNYTPILLSEIEKHYAKWYGYVREESTN